MYGAHIDTLNVYIQTGTSLGLQQWDRIGTQGNQWNYAKIDVNVTTPYMVCGLVTLAAQFRTRYIEVHASRAGCLSDKFRKSR